MVKRSLRYGCAALFLAVGVRGADTEPVVRQAETTDSERSAAGFVRLRDQDIPGLDRRVNLTAISAWDVTQVIDFLAHRGGLKNVVISPLVVGTTTRMRFDDVSVGEALEVVLQVNRLAYTLQGDIIKIMTDEEYANLHGQSFYDMREFVVVQLQYADPSRVAAMLQPLKSPQGSIVADPVSGNMVLIDAPGRLREMQVVIAKTDLPTVSRVIPTQTRVFNLRNAELETIRRELTGMLSADNGRMQVNEQSRTLVVTDLPHIIERIENVMTLFDVPPRQVFIEAKILEITLSDEFGMGINWQHVFDHLDPRMHVQTLLQPLGQGMARPTAALTYGTIVGGGDLTAVLHALQSYGSTRILANPHVAVLDGVEARIEVIEDQPYKEVTMEAGSTNITGVTYLFKKVGVQLGVTPKINDEGFITCDISPEISSISQWYDGLPQEGTPVVRKAFAETTVRVRDGMTIIIGGMIKNQNSTSKTKVPLLGSIPLLGVLFRSESTSMVSTETVVFLTPRIISGDEPYRLTDDVERLPLPPRALEVETQ